MSVVQKGNSEVVTPESQVESKPGSSSATPKAQRHSPPAVKRSAPKATGSGLLSSNDLFGASGTTDDKALRHGVDIDIRIQLNPAGGNTINMAQEILRKYGADALNPRAAAHRDRLLQVAAAANRLELGSGDDMSVDLSDADNDSNVEMGGMKDENTLGSAADGEKPKRTRTKKAEEYDKEDDFIDDTELAWEESAAVAKDGFFVYSGPLVREDQNKTDRYVYIYPSGSNKTNAIQRRTSTWKRTRPWPWKQRRRNHTRGTRSENDGPEWRPCYRDV